MKELKTLKDLKGKYAFYNEETENDLFNDIKAEAVKLVKKQIIDQSCDGDDFESLSLMQPHLFEWITFFNLTEEELENEKM